MTLSQVWIEGAPISNLGQRCLVTPPQIIFGLHLQFIVLNTQPIVVELSITFLSDQMFVLVTRVSKLTKAIHSHFKLTQHLGQELTVSATKKDVAIDMETTAHNLTEGRIIQISFAIGISLGFVHVGSPLRSFVSARFTFNHNY